MSITENNKLIDLFVAEFEKYESDRKQIIYDLTVRGCEPRKFNEYWDLLIPVV